ncbi:predicted protein [Botrytis cinerea T4]|uniref:Uncharacterized protein n=1 Tax=Botryotinia fuckeliana (strain T4) TaxID=999810 RepID=G2Y6C6_BOTF4|nr:predicted protein [Botrytis cinerea T4]
MPSYLIGVVEPILIKSVAISRFQQVDQRGPSLYSSGRVRAK